MEISEKRRELKQLLEEERADIRRAETEKRGFDVTERERDEKRGARMAELTTEIQAYEDVQRRAEKIRTDEAASGGDKREERKPVADAEANPFKTEEGRKLLRGYLARDITFEEMQRRGQSVGIYTEGGALVAPVQMRQTVLEKIDDEVFIRGLASIETVTGAESLGIPTIEDDLSDPEWTSELAPPTEDQIGFGGRELTPRRLIKLVKVSRELMRRRPDVEGMVTRRIARKYAQALENNYLNGNGIKKPLGVLNNGTNGISTARDTSTGSSITSDKMYDFEASLKTGYRRNATFMTHRLHWNDFRKLKSAADGRYLLDINTMPNTLATSTFLGRPLYLSEFFPSTKVAGDYAMLYCDWSYYQIADADSLTIEAMRELFRLNNQVGIIAELYSDGMPTIEEAFSRLKFS